MANSRNTKRALLTSVLSMMLCIALLIGSTFAWFTDSVTSSNNKIVAGNLDVELEYAVPAEDGTIAEEAWTSVQDATNLFRQDTLWEPGHAEVVYLRLRNAGTLALKYKFAMDIVAETEATNVNGDKFKLSQYLQYGLVENQTAAFADRDAAIAAVENPVALTDYSKENTLLAGADPIYLALVVYMPETVGNEANYRGEVIPTIDLGLNLFATQTPYESDSFDDQYDKKAWPYPEKAATVEELRAAVANTGNVQLAAPITYAPENSYFGNSLFDVEEGGSVNVDFAGNKLTIQSNDGKAYIKGEKDATITLSNGEIESNRVFGSSYPIIHPNHGTVILDNMIVTLTEKTENTYPVSAGSAGSDSDSKLIIKNSTVNGYDYAVYVGSGATAEIQNSTINGSFKIINNGTLIIRSGKFTADPSSYLAAGSTATKNSDGTWTVTAGN